MNGLTSVDFYDVNNGYAAGWYGTILKTTNGGLSWLPEVCPVNIFLNAVSAVNINRAYVAGQFGSIFSINNQIVGIEENGNT